MICPSRVRMNAYFSSFTLEIWLPPPISFLKSVASFVGGTLAQRGEHINQIIVAQEARFQVTIRC